MQHRKKGLLKEAKLRKQQQEEKIEEDIKARLKRKIIDFITLAHSSLGFHQFKQINIQELESFTDKKLTEILSMSPNISSFQAMLEFYELIKYALETYFVNAFNDWLQEWINTFEATIAPKIVKEASPFSVRTTTFRLKRIIIDRNNTKLEKGENLVLDRIADLFLHKVRAGEDVESSEIESMFGNPSKGIYFTFRFSFGLIVRQNNSDIRVDNAGEFKYNELPLNGHLLLKIVRENIERQFFKVYFSGFWGAHIIKDSTVETPFAHSEEDILLSFCDFDKVIKKVLRDVTPPEWMRLFERANMKFSVRKYTKHQLFPFLTLLPYDSERRSDTYIEPFGNAPAVIRSAENKINNEFKPVLSNASVFEVIMYHESEDTGMKIPHALAFQFIFSWLTSTLYAIVVSKAWAELTFQLREDPHQPAEFAFSYAKKEIPEGAKRETIIGLCEDALREAFTKSNLLSGALRRSLLNFIEREIVPEKVEFYMKPIRVVIESNDLRFSSRFLSVHAEYKDARQIGGFSTIAIQVRGGEYRLVRMDTGAEIVSTSSADKLGLPYEINAYFTIKDLLSPKTASANTFMVEFVVRYDGEGRAISFPEWEKSPIGQVSINVPLSIVDFRRFLIEKCSALLVNLLTSYYTTVFQQKSEEWMKLF